MKTTTLAIEKSIHERAAKRAKKEHISVSAVARILLEAYSSGKVNIVAVQATSPIEVYQHNDEELPQEIKNAAEKTYKKDRSEFVNL